MVYFWYYLSIIPHTWFKTGISMATSTSFTPKILSPQARAVDTIRQWIEQGKLRSNDQLPSERDLSAQLGVNRGTIRRALDRLTQDGLIEKDGVRMRVVAEQKFEVSSALFSKMICVLTVDPEVADDQNPIQTADGGDGAASLQAIRRSGLHGMAVHPDHIDEHAFAELIRAKPLGLIVSHAATSQEPATRHMLMQARDAGIPTVIYGHCPDETDFDMVGSDHQAGSYELTQWMINQGRKRILWCGSVDHQTDWVQCRLVGYRDAMVDAGLDPIDPLKFEVTVPRIENDREWFNTTVKLYAGHLVEYLTSANRLDGIVVVNDVEALLVIGACRLFGLKVGKDILVGGYDNCWHTYPEHQWVGGMLDATIDKGLPDIGRDMVDLVLEHVNHKPAAKRHNTIKLIPPKLILPSSMMRG